jgi:hypothetical protein
VLSICSKNSYYLNMNSRIKQLLAALLILFFLTPGFAYLSLAETAEIIPEGHYRIGLIPEIILARGRTVDVGAFLDIPIHDSLSSRFIIGSGDTSFYTGGSLKWTPFPDIDKQPAIGFKTSFVYARTSSVSLYNYQVSPLISKIVKTEQGTLIPYVGIPVTLIYANSTNKTAAQFTVGTEWVYNKDIQFGGELNLNLSETESSLVAYINFLFNGKTGFLK